MFVFGDSLVDNGNNNNLYSFAKANYFPNGIDFYQGPSGRFCNGKTAVDMLGEMLGLPYLPTFVQSKSNVSAILSGVNYASAAGGILDETGQQAGGRFSLSQQVMNFKSNMNDLRNEMGPNNLTQYLAKSIVLMVLGSNDYLNNYLQPKSYNSSQNYTPQAYADLLLNHYTRQILALHSVGLRKFFLAGIGPLGCTPYYLAQNRTPPGQCVSSVNEILGLFNVGLKSLVDQLNGNHTGAIFLYGNAYGAIGDMINNPSTYGTGGARPMRDPPTAGVHSSTILGENADPSSFLHDRVSEAANPSRNETDRLALIAFKGEIYVHPNGVLSSWNDSLHFCMWDGVTCSKRHPQRVTALNLTRQKLGGYLSPHIGNLSFLSYIKLSNNNFQGQIPEEIGHLQRLPYLDLGNNSLNGEIPINLRQCSELRILGLYGNKFAVRIPLELGSLSKLTWLDLNTNSLIGHIPHALGNHSSLIGLSLYINELDGNIPQDLG
ncbi:hypothetical protein MRB53_013573 [Persea americana]|uniref:Uncharacterized protein n=1 Tax=Persea americana TaxID=3435 RepID=A0ACC2K8V0_PERAE|nr:hypothetical protein MRB53_013573 [Persea americana]